MGIVAGGGEAGLLQAIDHPTGGEELAEQLVQRAVEVPVRRRFTRHARAKPRWHGQVRANLHEVFADVRRGALAHQGDRVVVEWWMLHREDEAASGRQQAAGGTQQGANFRHVHQGHAGEDGVERAFAEGQEGGFVGGIDLPVGNALIPGRRAGAGRVPGRRG